MSSNNSKNNHDDQGGSCLSAIPLLALFAATTPFLSKPPEEVGPTQNAELQAIRLSEELERGR